MRHVCPFNPTDTKSSRRSRRDKFVGDDVWTRIHDDAIANGVPRRVQMHRDDGTTRRVPRRPNQHGTVGRCDKIKGSASDNRLPSIQRSRLRRRNRRRIRAAFAACEEKQRKRKNREDASDSLVAFALPHRYRLALRVGAMMPKLSEVRSSDVSDAS